MRTYTTCASCQQLLTVHTLGQDTHDGCPEPTDYLHTLTRDYLAAVRAENTELALHRAAQLDFHNRRPPRLLAAALAYAAWGWPVFPCLAGHKRPAYAEGVIEHGLRNATTHEPTIRDWWTRWPQANIGLPTGRIFDVIDVEPSGLLEWARIREQASAHPGHPVRDIHGQVSTPRGGLHLYVPPTGDGNLAGWAPGIDFRGAGGYVLAPPSVLVPAAYKDPPQVPWPLRYQWWVRPSPVLTGGRSGGS